MTRRLWGRKILATCVLTAGCAGPRPVPPVKSDVAARVPSPDTRPTKPPEVLREAPLPAGYPPAGPEGVVVIKTYPRSRLAVTTQPAGRSDDDLFTPLFDHITAARVPMSTPVEMRYDGKSPVEMAFIYPDVSTDKPGDAGAVTVEDRPAVTVVSIGVRGAYTADSVAKNVTALNRWLARQSDYIPAGPPRLLAYNSPFVPWFARYAEVQIPVRRLAVVP